MLELCTDVGFVDRFPLATAGRTAKMGLLTGLTFGLLQDGLSLLNGRRLDYVDWLFGRRGKRMAKSEA